MDTSRELFIPVVLGTVRKNRRSEKAARFVFGQVQQYGVKTQLVDVRGHMTPRTIPPWEDSEETGGWKELADRADGFVIVVPEYNHGYPGELKMLLDQAYKQYWHKPASVCGVSGGGLGGARVRENLLPVIVEYRLVPIREAVYFSRVKELFAEDGSIKDRSYEEKVKVMLDELAWYASSLKRAREADAESVKP